jgi:hypothetical protein
VREGFSQGFNIWEAVNFATAGWLPFGAQCEELCRRLKADPILPRQELLCREAAAKRWAVAQLSTIGQQQADTTLWWRGWYSLDRHPSVGNFLPQEQGIAAWQGEFINAALQANKPCRLEHPTHGHHCTHRSHRQTSCASRSRGGTDSWRRHMSGGGAALPAAQLPPARRSPTSQRLLVRIACGWHCVGVCCSAGW